MKQLELKVSFTTPAFLGNAQQQGQWRTPPFKALLRQWWRVVWWNQNRQSAPTISQMRIAEEELFGSAAGDGGGGKSRLRLRLDHWKNGTLKQWEQSGFSRIDDQVRADVYLGFGPVRPASKKNNILEPSLAHFPALASTETATLRIHCSPRCSDLQFDQVIEAIRLAAQFGTLGSRSHNGWGSLTIQSKTVDFLAIDLSGYSTSLDRCFRQDWPHAIGKDETGLLIWKKPLEDWKQAVNLFASLRKQSRKAVKGIQGDGMKGSYLLGYPLTKSTARMWISNARFADQLRFKLGVSDDGLMATIIHLPCAVPGSLWVANSELARSWVKNNQCHVWKAVHHMLDNSLDRSGVKV